MPQQCPCEAWWQVLPAVLALSVTCAVRDGPAGDLPVDPPTGRPLRVSVSATALAPRHRLESGRKAHRELGFPAFKGYY